MTDPDEEIFGGDYEKFAMIFYKYGAQPHFKIDMESHFVHGLGGMSYPYAGRQYISLDAKFPKDGFQEFVKDINESREIIRRQRLEERLREENPTAQQAYEEYQIIINLIK
jgi:hypothetical protein